MTVLDRGVHAERIREQGLRVEGEGEPWHVRLPVVGACADLRRCDAVFVAVKTYALPPLLPELADLAAGGPVLVPFLNGVEASDTLIAAGVPSERILPGVAYLTAFKTGPGVIRRQGMHARLILGGLDVDPTDGLNALTEVLVGTGFPVETSDDVRLELWRKMILTCVLAAGCLRVGGSIGAVRGDPAGPALLGRAAGEVVAVGRARSVRLSDADVRNVLALIDRLPADFHPSLVHDLRAGRPTEIDALCGAVSRMGRDVGVETPAMDGAVAAA